LEKIPNTVTHLSFTGTFNKNLNGLIPESVKHLTLSIYFHLSLFYVPKTVSHLTIYKSGNYIKSKDILKNAIRERVPRYIENVEINII